MFASVRMLCVLTIVSACAVLSASSAAAQTSVSDFSVGPGTLLAKGTAIKVPITYACEGGGYNFLYLSVRQKVQGGSLVEGNTALDTGSGLPACTGAPQTITLTVYPTVGIASAYKSGVALAFVQVVPCDDEFGNGCLLAQTNTEIRLGNK